MERYEVRLSEGAGALARVVSLITARRWAMGNLEYTVEPERRLIVELAGRREQIEAQLGKLYDVLAVHAQIS